MSKATAPWEGENAPAEPKDATSTEPSVAPAPAPADPGVGDVLPEVRAPAQTEPTAKTKAVVGGEQASLALVNLVSSGMSMKEARAKLAKVKK